MKLYNIFFAILITALKIIKCDVYSSIEKMKSLVHSQFHVTMAIRNFLENQTYQDDEAIK